MRTNSPRYGTPKTLKQKKMLSDIGRPMKSSQPIPMWRVYLALACLSLCASCAVPTPPRPVVVTEYQCFMRPEWLQPTPAPALQDETVGQLLEENLQLSQALTSCNADKSKARQLIDRQRPPAAGGTR